ncbi:MerR family transcriptional regulator [bacterium]|nr:MerR family transcriptional regulator [bacterium]
MSALLSIGELARAAGVPVSTLRYYEREGLLTPHSRSESGYRYYSAEELERLKFLRLAQSVGLTLEDADLLLRRRADSPLPPEEIKALIRSRLERIDEQLAQLNELRCALQSALEDCYQDCECPKCDDLQLLHEKIAGDSSGNA